MVQTDYDSHKSTQVGSFGEIQSALESRSKVVFFEFIRDKSNTKVFISGGVFVRAKSNSTSLVEPDPQRSTPTKIANAWLAGKNVAFF